MLGRGGGGGFLLSFLTLSFGTFYKSYFIPYRQKRKGGADGRERYLKDGMVSHPHKIIHTPFGAWIILQRNGVLRRAVKLAFKIVLCAFRKLEAGSKLNCICKTCLISPPRCMQHPPDIFLESFPVKFFKTSCSPSAREQRLNCKMEFFRRCIFFYHALSSN